MSSAFPVTHTWRALVPAALQAQRAGQALTKQATTFPDAPAWVKTAVEHLQSQQAPTQTADHGVSFSPEDELPVVAALEKALGMPVKAVHGTTAAPSSTRGLILRLTMDSKTGTSWWLGTHSAAGCLFAP